MCQVKTEISTENISDSRTSSKISKLELIDDRSLAKLTWSHYGAVFLWLGWIIFFIFLGLALPVLFFVSPIYFSLVVAIIVILTVVPINRSSQPEWGIQIGSWIMHKAADYFGIKIFFENRAAILATSPAIFMLEPHFVLPVSIFAFSDFLNYFPGHSLVGCVTSACFNVPFMRHLYTWANGSTVEKKNLQRMLDRGVSVTVCPGGAREVMYLGNDKECVLYIKKRYGLVKLALRSGVPIIPSFTFGLRQTYNCWIPKISWISKLGKVLGYIPIFFFGIWGIPFAPACPCQLNVVVGNPIVIPKTENPTDEIIHEYHRQVLNEMERIYNDYRDDFGMGDVDLRLV